MKTIYIISIILILIIFFLHSKRNEHLLASNEGVTNIAKIYADANGTVTFNNINSTGNINYTGSTKLNNLNVSTTTKLNDLDVSGTTKLNNLDVSGIVNKKQNKARYIRIGNGNTTGVLKEDYWSIQEVEVYDHVGTNIARNKPVTVTSGTAYQPSNANWSMPQNIVNGNATLVDTDCYHGNAGYNQLEIDLGAEYNISQINIYNRYHSDYTQRANNTSIELLDSNRNWNRVIHTGKWNNIYSKEFIL